MYLLEDPGVWSTVHLYYLLKGAIYNVFDTISPSIFLLKSWRSENHTPPSPPPLLLA